MKAVAIHQPCPCGKSSNAYTENEDGSGKCFSCGKFFPGKHIELDNNDVTFQYLPWRGVNRYVMEKYRVATSCLADGTPKAIGFRYPNGSLKVRDLNSKSFVAKGDFKGPGLFGSDIFAKGGKELIVTEGELDAMSAHQMTSLPAVSVKNGAASALADFRAEFDYINSFEKVYLCFDNDEPGKSATSAILPLLNHAKTYIIKLSTYKDPNEYLEKDLERFLTDFKNAKRYTPDNIISSFSDIEKALKESPKESIASYPFKTLQNLTYGLREGEVVLIKAPEGIGKTEFIRAIETHILATTDLNVGVIHLEENKARTIKGFASYVLDKACHLNDSFVTPEEIFEAYKVLCKRDDRVHLYSHFGSDDPNVILNTIRFLVVACGVKVVTLDHISILVSGLETDDERQKLDYISTQLKMMAEELRFCLVLISHVNDHGQTRGSRNISKIADLSIRLDRNIVAEDPNERNTTYMTIDKNRFAGNTGPAGKLFFQQKTFQVEELA